MIQDIKMELDLGHAKDGGRVFADVELRYRQNGPKPEGVPELGISFDHTDKSMKRHGRGTSYGQLSELEFEPGALGYTVRFVWKGYHLNNLHSGCEHQRAAGWEEEGYNQHASEACPICGYHFGSTWQMVPLPDDVVALVKSWSELPPSEADDNSDWTSEGIKIKSEYGAPENRSFPEADGWTVTLTYQGRRMTFPYYKGSGHNGAEPELHEVMGSLLSDAGTAEQSFEDWCSDLGVGDDPVAARAIYKATVKQTAKLQRLLGDQYDRMLSEQDG